MTKIVELLRERTSTDSLICLHGFLGSGADFDPLLPKFIQSGYHNIHCPDLSSDLDGVVNRIQSFIQSSTEGSVDLLGYSMGGRIALHVTHQHPSWIKNLILIGASPGIQNETDRKKRLDHDIRLVHRLKQMGIKAFVNEWMENPIIRSQKNIPKNIRDKMIQRRYEMDPELVSQSLILLGTGALPSLWKELKNIQTPTTLITGDLDTKFCGISSRMAELMPNASHLNIPNVGHAAHLENIVGFTDAFLAFEPKQAETHGRFAF